MRSIVSEKEIKNAIFLRRKRRAPISAAAPSRDSITRSRRSSGMRSRLRTARSPHLVTLPEPANDPRLEALNGLIYRDSDFPEFLTT